MSFFLVAALIEELTERAASTGSLDDERILRQKLLGLGMRERIILEKFFYSHQWNVGSASVIRLLCETDLFSLPIYLIKLSSAEEQQNIFNDLIETEHYLLSELVKSSISESSIGHSLRNVVTEGISHLIHDLLCSSTITVPNYINELRNFLSPTEMEHLLDIHLTALLERDTCLARQAVAQQYHWHKENALRTNGSLFDICKAVCFNGGKTLTHLLDLMTTPAFNSWRFGLALVDVILRSEPELKSLIKKHLSELFTGWISRRNELNFHVMILLARAIAYSGGAEKESVYQQWYKYQLADINYTLKSKDDFQYALTTLQALVSLESDPDFLRTHIKVAIPAPPYCKSYVTEFKEMTKRREAICQSAKSGGESVLLEVDEDVIVID